jgi:hypothetical protein
LFGVFFVSPKGNELRSTAFLDDEFPREEGLFGPIEAATEFDAASYFARSPRCMALARNNTKHGSDLLLTSKRSTCTCCTWNAVIGVFRMRLSVAGIYHHARVNSIGYF